jgi:hypothetical protein
MVVLKGIAYDTTPSLLVRSNSNPKFLIKPYASAPVPGWRRLPSAPMLPLGGGPPQAAWPKAADETARSERAANQRPLIGSPSSKWRGGQVVTTRSEAGLRRLMKCLNLSVPHYEMRLRVLAGFRAYCNLEGSLLRVPCAGCRA